MTTLARALTLAGLLALALITLVPPGATRMWATPWTLALWAALVLPAAALSLRAFDARAPLVLPPRSWLVATYASVAVVFLSAALSPYAGISLRWSAPLLAGPVWFFIAFDWLHSDPGTAAHRHALLAKAGLPTALAIGLISIGLWFPTVLERGLREAILSRNAFPLGHSNYTAGLALLLLPFAVSGIWRHQGAWRATAALSALLALAMLFSSSSRGGALGLAALAVTSLLLAPISRKTKALLGFAAVALGLGFVLGNPRTRATFTGNAADRSLVAASDVQRIAMFTVGRQMGIDRPLLGWGPGTTPLVYPKYRAIAAGGVENVLQLHSAPVHLWAEFGLGGLACLLVAVVLVFRARHRAPLASITCVGYAAFALTDWQIDIPVFTFALALLAALLAPVGPAAPSLPNSALAPRRALGIATLLAIVALELLGRRDPTPELNVRALTYARDPAGTGLAITLLRRSLALNPDQEIAHFNLGWLLLAHDTPAAERHFRAAAQLVPDKGGVYFGLGLARLKQGHATGAARAFALECLNEPRFLSSPWWREPVLAATRDATAAAFAKLLEQVGELARPYPFDPAQLGRLPPGPGGTYRRTRVGYPVIMRNLDIAAPMDLYDVRESAPASARSALPPKGWLPSPLLLRLLDAPASPKP